MSNDNTKADANEVVEFAKAEALAALIENALSALDAVTNDADATAAEAALAALVEAALSALVEAALAAVTNDADALYIELIQLLEQIKQLDPQQVQLMKQLLQQ